MALRYAILEVGINPAVRQALSLCLTISNECIVGEPTVVRVIMVYFYAALVGGPLKCMLRLYGFLAREALLKVYECIP